MSVETELNIKLHAKDEASLAVRKLTAEVDRLRKSLVALTAIRVPDIKASLGPSNASRRVADDFAKGQREAARALRERFAFETRMQRQHAAETRAAERDRRAIEAATLRDFRERTRFAITMGRQRVADERQVAREQAATTRAAERDRRTLEAASARAFRERLRFATAMGRQRAAEERQAGRERDQQERREAREAAHQARTADRQRRGAHRDLSRAGGRVGDAAHEVTAGARTVSVYSAIGAGIVSQIASAGLKARSSIDSAEANTRMFGGLSRDQIEAARSGWLNGAAIDNGFRPADALKAWTETLKAGIPQIAAPDVTRSIMGASAGLDLNVAETTKLVGRLSTLTQDPKKFDADAIDRMLNSIATVAKVTAADSNELVSSLRRGAGVLGSSRMSVRDLTAFTGAGISAGMQEGKAGTFMDFLVNDLVNAKTSRGQRREDLTTAFRLLGLGSAAGVSRQAANDPTSLLLKIFERMEKMNPERAGRVASLIGMREWRGEVLQMMKAAPSLRQAVDAVRDPRNDNHLRQARDERLGTLSGLASQMRATAELAWEAIGAGLEDIVRDAGRFFLDLGRGLKLDVVKAHVRTLLDGFIDGLGFANVRELLERVFGRPGEMDFSRLNAFFLFAQGFGRGVREVIDNIMSVIRAFAGKDASAETLGNLTAKLIGFAAALTVVAPVVGILTGVATALGALGLAAIGLSKGLAAMGLLGKLPGSAAPPAGTPGAPAGGARGSFLGRLGRLALPAWVAQSMGLSREDQKHLEKRLLDLAKERARAKGLLAPEAEPPARVQRQIYQEQENEWRDLIRPASYRTDGGALVDGVERLNRSIAGLGANLRLSAASVPGGDARAALAGYGVGGGGGTFGGYPATGGSGGTGYGVGLGREPGRAVPGGYGQMPGMGGGSASSNPANSKASAAMLDAIAGTESGRAGYDAVLGNGRYGTPSKPVSTMTLDEAFAFGRQVRARHGSSSALGRYQIVGNTMRAAQKALGLDGSTVFNAETQDRMARWVARNQGLGAWEGLKHNPAAMARARAAMAAGGAQDTPAGSGSAPGEANVAGGVHPLDGKGRLTSEFGVRRHPISGRIKHHAGIDLAAPAGTIVRAMRDGIASLDRSGDVTVRHDDGTSTTYRHVVAGITAGARVAAGQAIARLRAHDPRSTGPHLHLEARDAAGGLIDPKGLLGAAPEAVAGATAKAQKAAEGFAPAAWKRAADGLAPRMLVGGDPGNPDPGILAKHAAPSGGPSRMSVTPSGLADQVPARPAPRLPSLEEGGSGFRGGGASSASPNFHVTINGANRPNAELAGAIQRHVTEAWAYRAHDLEPELT